MLICDDDVTIYDSDDNLSLCNLFSNIHRAFSDTEFLGLIYDLAYANTGDKIDIDDTFASIRKEITDEPSLSPKQYEYARKLFVESDEENEIYAIYDGYLDDPEVATMRIIEKLSEAFYPDNDFLRNLATLAVDKAEGIHSVEPTDKSLAKIREAIIGEPTPSNTIPETSLSPTQIAFAESLFDVGHDFEITDGRIENGSPVFVEDILTNLSNIYPENKSLELLHAISIYVDCYDAEEGVLDELLSQLREVITGESPIYITHKTNEFLLRKQIDAGQEDGIVWIIEQLLQTSTTDFAADYGMYRDQQSLDVTVYIPTALYNQLQAKSNE